MKYARIGITAVLAAAFIGYPLSFGPACWLASRSMISEHDVAQAYKPLVYLAAYEPTRLLSRWANLGTPYGGMIFFLLQDLNPEPPPPPPGWHPGGPMNAPTSEANMTRNASVLLLAACAALAGVGSAQDNGPPAIEGWGTVVNPDGDCSLKTDEGKLVIKVPGGQHDLWFGRKQFNAPRVLQEVQGDFVAQVKVSADWKPSGQIPDSKSSPFNAAGLVVWDSEKQYLRFERNRVKHDKYFNLLTPVYDRDGKRQNDAKWSEQDTFKGRSTWLRIERTGQKITAAISHDGQKWTDRGSLTTTFPKKVRVGVFAINYSTSEFVAEFEEFKVDGK